MKAHIISWENETLPYVISIIGKQYQEDYVISFLNFLLPLISAGRDNIRLIKRTKSNILPQRPFISDIF